MANSIDYGMGMTNIDHDTGIRFGVISAHEVLQAWYDSSEPDYGKPSCPKCGNEVTKDRDEDYTNESWYKHNRDYSCPDCEYCFDSDEAYGDEPSGHNLDDGEYIATQGGNDSDIFVVKSPYYTLCEFCSPCAPGAGYLLNEGEVKSYCFGHEWFEGGRAPYKVYSVATGQEVLHG